MPATLLVLDLQQALIEGAPDPRSTPNLTDNVRRILAHWRAKGWPLIHVHHNDADPDHPLRADKPEKSKAHECSAPVGDEVIFTKGMGCSFPAFDHLLHQGTKKLVIIGMDGAQCVSNNARHASDLGMDVVVVSDGCSTFGMWDYRYPEEQKRFSAQETHDLAMIMLSNGYATIVTTDELLKQKEHDLTVQQ